MNAIELITEERKRQIETKGYTLEHDSAYKDGELAFLACYYAMPCLIVRGDRYNRYVILPDDFRQETGWSISPRQEHTRLRQLTIAGALIAAEIDRYMDEMRRYQNENMHLACLGVIQGNTDQNEL